MSGFAEVRFKGTRTGYFSFRDMSLNPGAHVIVEADRGDWTTDEVDSFTTCR